MKLIGYHSDGELAGTDKTNKILDASALLKLKINLLVLSGLCEFVISFPAAFLTISHG